MSHSTDVDGFEPIEERWNVAVGVATALPQEPVRVTFDDGEGLEVKTFSVAEALGLAQALVKAVTVNRAMGNITSFIDAIQN